MVLESASFCIAEDKTKWQVNLENRGLVSEDAAQLFAEACRTDRWQAKIVPVLKSVLAAKSGPDLWPMLSVHLGNVFLTTGNKVWRNQQWIRFQARTCSCSRRSRSGWWFWRCIFTTLVRPPRFFCRSRVCPFISGGAFANGLCSWMRSAQVSQRCSLRDFFAGGSPEPVCTSYN